MNYTLALGPFVLSAQSFTYILSVLLAMLWLYILQRKHAIVTTQFVPMELAYACTAGVLIWKGSYIILHPIDVFANPLRLIYYNGGTLGIMLGLTSAIGMYYVILRKDSLSTTQLFQLTMSSLLFFVGVYWSASTYIFTIYKEGIVIGIICIFASLSYWFAKNALHNGIFSVRVALSIIPALIFTYIIFHTVHITDWWIWTGFAVWLALYVLDFRVTGKRKCLK
ncbi:hypothetical protein ACFFGV_15570 [Pontibacillus salicampi]|uniref:Uncharacterized protein n=1 Tax=Pontibacillus salicampi TaxID=1449801 RepID=A0ABV6LRX3_9BACI